VGGRPGTVRRVARSALSNLMMVRSVEVQAELLRAEEVAQLLGVGRSKVFEMIRSRELPMIRMGRSVRVPPPELSEGDRQRLSFLEDMAESGADLEGRRMMPRQGQELG
jgi:excisionase family DNA binding protein